MPGWGGQSQLLVQGRGGAANRGFCCFKSSASVWLNQGASACLWEGCSGTTALQLAPPSPPPPVAASEVAALQLHTAFSLSLNFLKLTARSSAERLFFYLYVT